MGSPALAMNGIFETCATTPERMASALFRGPIGSLISKRHRDGQRVVAALPVHNLAAVASRHMSSAPRWNP